MPQDNVPSFTLAMREAGFNVSQLARITGLRRETISRIKAGRNKPTRENCASLAIALGKSLETVIGWFYNDPVQVVEINRETRIDAEIAVLVRKLKRKLAQKNGIPLSVYRDADSLHRKGYIYVTSEELAHIAKQITTKEPFTDCINIAEYSDGAIEGGYLAVYEIKRKLPINE